MDEIDQAGGAAQAALTASERLVVGPDAYRCPTCSAIMLAGDHDHAVSLVEGQAAAEPVLPVDALEALANALILSVAPGVVTSVEATATEIVVRSSLASPFPDRTPSLWVTRLSRQDGHTISSDPVVLSVPVSAAADLRTTVWHETYANREIVAHDTTRPVAEAWARRNVPSGWHLVGVTSIKGSANFTVRFRRGQAR